MKPIPLLSATFLLLTACQSTAMKNEETHSTSTTTTTTMATTETNTTTSQTTVTPAPKEVTTQATLPRKVVLPTPHIQQEVWYYCAPTTVSMMLATRGITVDQYTLAEEMGTYEPYGTHNRDAIRILNKHLVGKEYPTYQETGYHLVDIEDTSDATRSLFEQRAIKNFNDGYPMYYTIDVSKVYPGYKGEHNVIGIGYEINEEGTQIEWLYYYDPAKMKGNNQLGEIKKITPQHLLEAMFACDEKNYAY